VDEISSLRYAGYRAVNWVRIYVDGAFDPNLHDAVGTELVEGKESGSINKVMQDGWSLHGKVLRPAKVIIAQ
jgi:molecular chaperone GrpE (heat shock protein)